jgi:hypothetical protein
LREKPGLIHWAVTSPFKTGFSVILNEVQDLKAIENTRFFAALRMTTRANGIVLTSFMDHAGDGQIWAALDNLGLLLPSATGPDF